MRINHDRYIQGMLLGRMWATSFKIQAAAVACIFYASVYPCSKHFHSTKYFITISLSGSHFNLFSNTHLWLYNITVLKVYTVTKLHLFSQKKICKNLTSFLSPCEVILLSSFFKVVTSILFFKKS